MAQINRTINPDKPNEWNLRKKYLEFWPEVQKNALKKVKIIQIYAHFESNNS